MMNSIFNHTYNSILEKRVSQLLESLDLWAVESPDLAALSVWETPSVSILGLRFPVPVRLLSPDLRNWKSSLH